jgi:hypothetical protein
MADGMAGDIEDMASLTADGDRVAVLDLMVEGGEAVGVGFGTGDLGACGGSDFGGALDRGGG